MVGGSVQRETPALSDGGFFLLPPKATVQKSYLLLGDCGGHGQSHATSNRTAISVASQTVKMLIQAALMRPTRSDF